MLEMLLKSLGITPEQVTSHIDEFKNMAHRYETRIAAIEASLQRLEKAHDIHTAEKED